MALAVQEAHVAALDFAQRNEFEGPDPYDGLTSPMASYIHGRLPRQVWTQAHKHLGEKLRAATRVTPIRMAKAMALFAQGCALTGREDVANLLVDDLLRMQGGGPWGYEFDVQTRWAFYPKGSPNVVATTYALRAVASVGRIGEVPDSVGGWLETLWNPGGYFQYTSSSDTLIHNGSLLAAESLALLGCADQKVSRAIDTVVDAQDVSGAWPYGRGSALGWKDSFHTVYVLDSLSFLASCGFDVGNSIEIGINNWKNHFFTSDGRPTYFTDDKAASRDVHNIATALGALVDYRGYGLEGRLFEGVLNYLLEFQAQDGGFRNSKTSLPFMRWNQGHAFLALSKCIAAERGN